MLESFRFRANKINTTRFIKNIWKTYQFRGTTWLDVQKMGSHNMNLVDIWNICLFGDLWKLGIPPKFCFRQGQWWNHQNIGAPFRHHQNAAGEVGPSSIFTRSLPRCKDMLVSPNANGPMGYICVFVTSETQKLPLLNLLFQFQFFSARTHAAPCDADFHVHP